MGWTSRLLLLCLLGIATCQQRSIGGTSRSRNRVTGKTEILQFNCPEDFGYYPHPSDCTQYYVCVFGGALQESCTGGLMYSHELQTCDWPRNVICTLSTGGVSTVRITDPRTSASTPIRPATESLTPSVGSFSGSSSFPSQDSQATDLFPVRIQGGSGRDGRDFTSSPSQQSLAQATIAHVSRFPQTKALQESSIRSVFKTNNPGAFQYLEKQLRRTRDTSTQLGTQFADFSNQDIDIRQPPQDFSLSLQEQRNHHPRNSNHPPFPNAGFAHHKQTDGPSAHTSFFELPQRTFQNTHFQNNPFGGNSFQIQSQFNRPSPPRSSPANSFGNFQSFSPPTFSSSDSRHPTFDDRPGQHPPPSHASSFPQNHISDSPSHHRFPQPPQHSGFPPSHLNPNFPPQPSHNPHFPPQSSHAQNFPFNPQGAPHIQSSDPFRVDEARPAESPKPNHFTTPRPQNSLNHNSPPHFNQHPPPQFPPPLPSRHFPSKQNNFPKGQFPPPQSGFPPKSHPRFPPPPHTRFPPQIQAQFHPQNTAKFPPKPPSQFPPQSQAQFPPQSTTKVPPKPPSQFPPQSQAQFPPQTTAKFPPKLPSQFPPQRPEQFPPPSTSRVPQQNLPVQEKGRFPYQTDEAVVPTSETLKLFPKPSTISAKKPQINLSSVSNTTPKPHIISPTKSEPSSISRPKASNSKSRMPKPSFPEFTTFTTKTPTKKNPSRVRVNSSKPPRIPGTARQPELSRLSAVKSNPAGSQFPSSLPSSSSPHKRPLNSIGRPISRYPGSSTAQHTTTARQV